MSTRKVSKNRLKASVWGARSKMEVDGTIDGAIVHVFYMIDSPKRRLKVIEEMQEAHQRLCAVETNPETAG